MQKRSSLLPLPGIIALYYVVHAICFARAFEFTTPAAIVAGAVLITCYCYALYFLIYSPRRPLSLTAVPLLTMFTLFYQTIRDQIFSIPTINYAVRHYFWDKHNLFVIGIFVAGSLLIQWYLSRSSGRAILAAKSFMVFFSLLIVMDIGTYYKERGHAELHPSSPPVAVQISSDKPDVYFIIFDSQTSPSSLEKYWKFRSDTLEQKLLDRGMFIAHHGRSNYNWTPYSITSILNMSYLREETPVPTHTELPASLTAGVVKLFTDNGYVFHNLSFFDVNGAPHLRSIIQYSMWESTIFYYLYDRFTDYSYKEFCRNQREMLHLTGDSLESVIDNDTTAPKFIYVHFYIPHTPAFVDRDGADYISTTKNVQDKNGYLRQVIYSYSMMDQLVDRILKKSAGKAIILIQGDHGYRYLEGKEKMAEQFDAFKGFYFPDRNYRLLNDSTISVNTFRIVLNSEFGTSLPLLPDSSFNILLKTLNTLP